MQKKLELSTPRGKRALKRSHSFHPWFFFTIDLSLSYRLEDEIKNEYLDRFAFYQQTLSVEWIGGEEGRKESITKYMEDAGYQTISPVILTNDLYFAKNP